MPVTQAELPTEVEAVRTELHAHWSALLALDDAHEAREVQRNSSALREDAMQRFAARCAGWPGARFHSPDVLIAARDVEALRRGDYQLVLGEIHVAMNNVAQPVMAHQAPNEEELLAARVEDEPCLVFTASPRAGATRRLHFSSVPEDVEIEIGNACSPRPPSHLLRTGELFVVRGQDGLEVRSRVTRARMAHLTEVMGSTLANLTAWAFQWMAPRPHTPRVLVDEVVIARESWRFANGALGFLTKSERRFLDVRRWARSHGMPRHLFFKVPEEPKPYYLDTDSPIAIDHFVRKVAGAVSVLVSEMLPSPDDCWLVDSESRRYTSELRMAAVDPVAWSPSSSE
jgi:hypothetical protein